MNIDTGAGLPDEGESQTHEGGYPMTDVQEREMLTRINACLWQLAKAVGMVAEGEKRLYSSPEEITDRVTNRLIELDSLRHVHSDHVGLLRTDVLRQNEVIDALAAVASDLAEQLAQASYNLGRVEFIADASVDVLRLVTGNPVPEVVIARAARLVQCHDSFKGSDGEPGQ